MPIPGNPKGFARDIADGFFIFNRATCRQFSPSDLKVIYQNLSQVSRELRAEQIPLGEIPRIQQKNIRLQRANSTLLFIRNYAKQNKIIL